MEDARLGDKVGVELGVVARLARHGLRVREARDMRCFSVFALVATAFSALLFVAVTTMGCEPAQRPSPHAPSSSSPDHSNVEDAGAASDGASPMHPITAQPGDIHL